MGLYREWSKSVYLQHGMTENRIKTMDYIFLKLLQDGNMGAWHRSNIGPACMVLCPEWYRRSGR